MTDPRFSSHNLHLESTEAFAQHDPNLRLLRNQPLIHRFPLLAGLPRKRPGIYTITGGRQIGKTTVLKQWMSDLMRSGTPPFLIRYLTGELIDDHHALVRVVNDILSDRPSSGIFFLLIDEVTYIRDWDKGVKYLADAGMFENVVVVLTGSDSVIIREARARFPGRRGTSDIVDFHLFPLSFHEFVSLANIVPLPVREALLPASAQVPPEIQAALDQALQQYLAHGGYLTAINDMAREHTIRPATFATYCDWIRGDVLKRGKQEQYLREVLGAVVKRYGSQVTWNALARDLSIDHPATVADYLNLLAAMDAVFIQPVLVEDKLTGAPKKARRVMFCDPFIYHAVRSWLQPNRDPFRAQLVPSLENVEGCARIVEACAVTHVRRFHPTYYIKAEGEVDIAYVDGRRMWPIEIKWTGQLRPKALKQIAKYRNGRVWCRSWETREIGGVSAEPLPLALFRLGPSPITAWA